MTTLAAQSRACWDADASSDIKAPSVGALIRWSRRAALAKAEVIVAERTLAHWLGRARDAFVSAMALPVGSLRDHVEAQAPTADIMLAEEKLTDAIEAEDFAARVCRLLERPRAERQQDVPQQNKPRGFTTVQGGRR